MALHAGELFPLPQISETAIQAAHTSPTSSMVALILNSHAILLVMLD